MCSSTLSLTLDIDGMGCQPHARLVTHCAGGVVVPRANRDGCGKSRLHRHSFSRPYIRQRVAILRNVLFHYILKNIYSAVKFTNRRTYCTVN